MLPIETFGVDYQEVQKVLNEINVRYQVFIREEKGGERFRRVNGRYQNHQIWFVESDGLNWRPGVTVDLNVIRPEQRADLLRSIAEVYFSQGWESEKTP